MSMNNTQRGFTLIEVLVTLLIISLALLGSAGLQAYAMKTNLGGQYRTQAAFLLEDMVERMEANKPYSVSASGVQGYDTSLNTTTDCGSTNCTAASLAAYDLTQWQAAIAAVLPQGAGTVTQIAAGNPSSYKVTINWVDRKSNITYSAASAVPSMENFSITTSRTIGIAQGN